jgi:hypothetical protein
LQSKTLKGKKMSRSGYRADFQADYVLNLYRANVDRCIAGKHGQKLLKELVEALDAMPVKELIPNSFMEKSGRVCALGAVAKKRSLDTSDLMRNEEDCIRALTAERFAVKEMLTNEIMFMNDEVVENFVTTWVDIEGPMRHWEQKSKRADVSKSNHKSERFDLIRKWAMEKIKR